MVRNLSIRQKNLVLVVMTFLGVLAVSAIALTALHANLLEDRKERARNVVEIVHGVLDGYDRKVESGELGPEEARRRAAAVVSSLRFGDGGYFWINDLTPKMVVHPYRTDLVGRDVSSLEDLSGTRMFIEFIETVRRDGAGYVTYYWNKPEGTEPVKKISYVRGFGPWGWIVGSGVYVDDVDMIFWSQAKVLALTAFAVLVVVLGISWSISLNISRPMAAITASMSRLSTGDTSVPVAFADRGDEVGDLARAMNVFKQNFLEIEELRKESERSKEQERQAIRESEERFRDFAEASSDWLWETGADGRVAFVSHRIADGDEYDPKDIVGKSAYDIAEILGCQDQAGPLFSAVEARKSFRDLRFEVVSTFEQPRVIRLSGKPRFADNGTFLGYRGAGADISAAVFAVKREERAQKRFMSAIQSFPMGIALFDAEDRLVVCNDRYREINPVGAVLRPGVTYEQLLRATVEKGIATLARGREEAYIRERIALHRNPGGPIERKFSDHWAVIHEYRTDEGDTLLATLDISDRKRTEDALRASEEKFRGLFEHANDSIFLTEPGTGLILEANATAEEKTGCSRGEMNGKDIRDFFRVLDGNAPLVHVDELAPYSPAVVEAEQLHVNGSGTPVEISSRLIHYGSKSVLQSIVRDISIRKEMQQQLIDVQKKKAIGELTGGIAHDFNNLLTVIMGSLDWLQEIVGKDDRSSKLVGTALEAAQRGADLTRSLLAYARRQALSPESIDLTETFSVIQPLLAQALPETIIVEIDVQKGLWPVLADPVQLESAILNLAFNARDAMPGYGRLLLQARNCDESEATSGADDCVLLSFEDTGCGMPADVLAQACDPFFTTKEVGEGSGLGLSMVKGFVEQSGGKLTIESAEGRGTTIKLSLPRAFSHNRIMPWSIDIDGKAKSVSQENIE